MVAAATSGSVPPWATASLVLLLLAGGSISGGRSLRERRRAEREFTYQLVAPSPEVLASDFRVAGQALSLVGDRAVPWLRMEAFSGPWREDRLKPLREFVELMATRPAIGSFDLDVALEDLLEAVTEFVTTHDGISITDPLTLESSWRMVRGIDPETNTASDEAVEHAKRLCEEANRIVGAFAELRRATIRIQKA